MATALMSGARIAVQCWWAVLTLFLANLGLGLSFTAASWMWLSQALGASLATRTLLTHLDMNVFVDLFVHHAASLRMFVIGGAWLALGFTIVSVWLNAVVVVAVGEDGGMADSMTRGLQLYPKFFALWGLTAVADAASVTLAYFVGRGLARWTAESVAEMSFYWAVGGGVLVAAVAVLFFTTVHDHARIHVAATGAGVARAYAWALSFVALRNWRAVPLVVVVLAVGLSLWVGYQTVGMLMVTSSGPWLALSLVWGELLLLSRLLLRVWLFAAETELQRAADEAAA